jgi:hypothetical protein
MEADQRSDNLTGPLRQLLDDVPVVAMITDYGALRRLDDSTIALRGAMGARQIDVCSGWAKDGELAAALGRGRPFRLSEHRPADGTPLELRCSHTTGAATDNLQPGDQRRRRLLEVRTSGRRISARARLLDTYLEPNGWESPLHDYWVDVTAHRATGLITHAVATPGALPVSSCARAVASAGWIIGMRLGNLRQQVSDGFRGPSTCTHLNDVLRSLDAVTELR